MKLLISGATGLVGTALTQLVEPRGITVMNLTRSPKRANDVAWDPASGELNRAALDGVDAIVHLAGESIASGRWSADRKRRILDSRVKSTRLLAHAAASLDRKPNVFISASAIGYYGNRGAERLTEESASGDLFLSDVCRQWEDAAQPAQEAGIRVVHARFGVILSPDGGALQKMLTPFRLGLGGIVGDGRQYWSWITLADTVRAIEFALQTESLSGPVNVVAPHPVTNAQFTKTLGQVLHRPTVFPLPAFAARLVLGEMADELLLASANVEPQRLEAAGFNYLHAQLEPALRQMLT